MLLLIINLMNDVTIKVMIYRIEYLISIIENILIFQHNKRSYLKHFLCIYMRLN